jgi:predicted phage terminase large subunit-like protein
MASVLPTKPQGIRLDELAGFARSVAKQVWEQDAGLNSQADERELLAWLRDHFPGYVFKPFGKRHIRLWDWFESLTPGQKPAPRVEPWPRGGAKSTTGEMGVTRAGYKGTRKFCLYVSGTQEQADLHVQNIADLFEKLGLDRALNKYGHSKGWRRNQLRVGNGFNVQALGLDTASRGIKIEEFRPDLIIFDDIDSQDDSPKTVEKKAQAIKSAIIPAGSSDCAVLFLQNLIHEEGIVAQLCDDRADFLLDREIPEISVAVEGLKVESVDRGDGRKVWRIVSGVPTWEGQDIETCEKQINEWGLKTFLREAQHEVQGADGYFFDHTKFEIIDELPDQVYRYALSFDFAATEGGGDYTASGLTGWGKNGVEYILDVFNKQISSEKVRTHVVTQVDWLYWNHPGSVVHIPQDPGQAGKDQADQYRQLLKKYTERRPDGKPGLKIRIEPVNGKKGVRARGYQEQVNSGNVKLMRGEWNYKFIEQHRKFREDEEHEHDDMVDVAADNHNELAVKPRQIEFTAY